MQRARLYLSIPLCERGDFIASRILPKSTTPLFKQASKQASKQRIRLERNSALTSPTKLFHQKSLLPFSVTNRNGKIGLRVKYLTSAFANYTKKGEPMLFANFAFFRVFNSLLTAIKYVADNRNQLQIENLVNFRNKIRGVK